MTLAMRPLIVTEPEPRKCRADYESLSTDDIYRLLGRANCWARMVDTEEDEFEVTFMIQELRAVLQDRNGR